VRSKILITASTAAGVLLATSPALAGDTGLYGSSDPSFDGVYRQSLSILALEASDRQVPASAVKWLKKQQCSDGGFEAYRARTSTPCNAPDPAGFSGQDSNSTALAAAALWHTGDRKQARRAAKWLTTQRNSDGGWAYYPGDGATSDTNSTALALGALTLVRGKQQAGYLRSVQQRCSAPKKLRGGLAFDTSFPDVNDNSTAQAAWTLGGGLGLPKTARIKKSSPRLKCGTGKTSTHKAAIGYLNKRLSSVKGELPFGGGFPGTDYAGAATATIALANQGAGRASVRTTSRFLERSAKSWVTSGGADSPGSLALLLLVADSTRGDAKDFGGMNLIKRLNTTLTR
jgi:hypothetical protein